MELHNAGIEDTWIIQSLAKQIWCPTYENIISPEQMDYMMDMMYSSASLQKQILEQEHHYILLKNDGEYLGYLSYENNYNGKPCTKIHKIYIMPSMQGKGLGRFMLESVSDMACKNGCIELSLNMNRDNPAIGFYQKVGFTIVGSEDIDIGNGFLMEDYILNKKL